MTEDGKEKKLSIDFEPFKPINTSMYLCDSRFHTEPLGDLLQDDKKFGFIVMDGNGCLFGTLCGNHREVVHKFSVELPKKHGRGGQSALRFARLRLEKRHNYVRKVAESAVNAFISADQPNVAGLVLAGSAEFKNQLQTSDLFDPRLAGIVVKVVDVSYGGENGFNQAIELSAEALANVKFVAEKKLVGQFFDEIARDTGCYCVGVRDIMHALDMSAVETLIVYEDLEDQRYELRNPATGEITVKYFRPDQEKERALFQDPETGVDLDVADKMPLVEWLAQNFKSFGTKLEFISDKSQEGSQFVQGFGGIGGLLRWKVDFMELAELIEGGYEVEDDDDFM
ncbi:eRF1 [Symbiodinium sp. KB8]|nr:eRF1 [Symbiodinium sp. KB8]